MPGAEMRPVSQTERQRQEVRRWGFQNKVRQGKRANVASWTVKVILGNTEVKCIGGRPIVFGQECLTTSGQQVKLKIPR